MVKTLVSLNKYTGSFEYWLDKHRVYGLSYMETPPCISAIFIIKETSFVNFCFFFSEFGSTLKGKNSLLRQQNISFTLEEINSGTDSHLVSLSSKTYMTNT